MKFVKSLILLFLFTITILKASNPGSNYGCESDVDHKFYTHWTNTASASPTDPGWHATFQCYDDAIAPYDPNYDPGPVPCGQANPGGFTSAGQVCWINVAGNWQQGALKTFTPGSIVPCPIDSYVFVLVFGFGIVGVRTFYKKEKLT